ncbi:MAG: hypothetical protein GXO89_12970 [Chlorobi bacterium]|nr:hypothetical protein [Chlorobiota bacterium]
MKNNTFNSFKNLCSPFILTAVLIIVMFAKVTAQMGIEDYQSNSIQIDNLLRLTVEGNTYSDQTLILFIAGATEGFDSDYDAYKLSGILAAPQFYSIITCCNLAVNALPVPIPSDYSVQMGFDVGVETTYTISATDLYTFDPSVSIHLLDSRDNVLIDLLVDSVYSFTAAPGDDSKRFKVYFNKTSEFLNLNVLLEGPFNGTDMNTELNDNNYIPSDQPYNPSLPYYNNNSPVWQYTGTESVTGFPAGAVDWVLVQLRDADAAANASSATIIDTQAAFLLKDGSIVGRDGIGPISFDATITQKLWAVIFHRSHLGVISNYELTKTDGIYTYDFTTSSDQVLGGVNGYKELASGVWGMVAGDGNGTGIVGNDDETSVWKPDLGTSGYSGGDYNMNGVVQNTDETDYWKINLNGGGQVPPKNNIGYVSQVPQ